jgi:hypothetical protein
VSQIIRFRRPEAPDSICSMFVADEGSTETHIRRIQSLGYIMIVDSTPLAGRPQMRSELVP